MKKKFYQNRTFQMVISVLAGVLLYKILNYYLEEVF
jgi:hypothetical protein